MRRSRNYFYKRLACTRSALTSRAIADAIFFAVLLSAMAVALGPSISIQLPLNITYAYSAITLNYTYFNATYCKYELANSSGSFNTSLPTCQNTTLSGVTEGANSVKVWANDSANNWNTSDTVYFSIDMTPSAWAQVPANQTVVYNTSFSYDINATDPSGVDKYWINDNANFTINSSSGLITNNTLLALGTYLLNVSANDTLGNTNSALFMVSVLFDLTVPAISLLSPQPANYTTATPNLSVSTSENSTIIYNWDGAGNITGCRNCTSYNSTYGELVSDADALLLLHFNENYGNVSYDQGGRYNGTIYGANWTAGRFGYALLFDGVNGYANLSNSTNPAGTFTIAAWVNATGNQSSMAVVDKYENTGGGAGYSLFLNTGRPRFGVYNDGSWGTEIEVASDIRNTGWHYIAGIYNGSALKIVLDDASAATSPGFNYAGGAAPSSVNLTIGNRPGQSWHFNGTIDEIRLTSRALNDIELAASRNRRLSDGSHNLTVFAIDNYGNLNTSFVSFNTDGTLPFCTFLTANRTYFRNGTPLNFTAFCNDTYSGVASVYLNASAIGGGIVQMSPIGGGNYTYSLTVNNNRSESVNVSIYNVTDAYGGANYSNPILALTVDNLNPGVYLNMSLNQSWQKGTISLNYNATDSQTINSCVWRWQNLTGVWGNYSALACGPALAFQFNTTDCPDNSTAACRIELFANDSAGNSNSSELYLRVDNSAPNISSILPLNNSVVYSNTTHISFNITDIASGVNMSTLIVNDSLLVYNTSNISCTPLTGGFNCSLSLAQADGLKSITISAYDNLSNLAQSIVYYTVGGCQAPASGNWELNYTQSCANKTIILNGNLTVQSSGNLTFRNVTLLMNGTYNGSRKIEVQGGAFYILDNDGIQSTNDGSNITALDTANRFLFIAWDNSTVEMMNSELSYAGYAGGGIIGVYIGAGETFYLGEGALFYNAKLRLTGSTISNSFNGVVGQVENATIENNTILSNSGSGIQLSSGNSAIIRNKIVSNSLNGIFLLGSTTTTISDNNVSSNGRGLRMYASSNNTALNNTISSNSGSGIAVEANSENNTLRYNTILSNNYGIHIQNSSGTKVWNNTLPSNSYGLRISSARRNTVSNNTITSTNLDGLYLDSANANNFSGNTISGSVRYALYVANSQNNSFSQDTFGGYYGLYLSASNNNTFGQSTVSSTLDGIHFTASSNNTIASATITSGSGPDLNSELNSTNILLNSTYSSSKTYFENSGSKIIRQWYLRMTTVNISGSSINGTNITVFDNQSALAFSGLTGSDGALLMPITEKIVSTTVTNYTPHRVLANINGFFGNASAAMSESRNITIILYDLTAPQVLDHWFEPQYLNPNQTTAFRVQVRENAAISRAWFRLTAPSGTYNYTLSFQSENSTGQTWYAQITNTSMYGQYNATYLFVNDTSGSNHTPAATAYFRVQSDLPPNVTYADSGMTTEVNLSLTIGANITDDNNITAAYLQVISPESTQSSMQRVSGNSTAGLWQASYTPAQNGTYVYQIAATDNSSNTGYSGQYYFTSLPYDCNSISRQTSSIACLAVGCLWKQEAAGVCSFYNSSADKNRFETSVNSGNLTVFLTSKDTIGRLTSTTDRNVAFTASINSQAVSVTLPLSANMPREVGILTNGLLLSTSNSTIQSVSYSDYKFSSTINGSGNVSVLAYTSTFGAPENITLDNASLPFSYSNTTKTAEFNISLGSPHTIGVKFTQPCAPSGGQCGTCCSGLTCCSGICSSSCTSQQTAGQQQGAQATATAKSVSITASTANVETKIGVPASFTVKVKNIGNENLTAVTIDFANITRGWFTVNPAVQNIPIGAEVSYAITVNPPLDGRYNFSVYVPTPRSQYVQMHLAVANEYSQASTPDSAPLTAAATGGEGTQNMQELELLLKELEANITAAKNQGADTSSIEKTLEEARLAISEGKHDKAKLLLDYIQGEIPKIKTSPASAASGMPTIFIALIALSVMGFLAARYKDQLFPRKLQEGGSETVTFSRETESTQKSIKARISELRERVVQADLAIDGGDMQKAAEVYQAVQKEYDDLVINSVGADAETQMALNEIYASIERIYERLSKNG